MAIRHEDLDQGARIPAQRGGGVPVQPAAGVAVRGDRAVAVARPVRAPAPSTVDVALGMTAVALDAARSVVDVGTLVGRQTLDHLPVPAFVRGRVRDVVRGVSRTGRQRRAAVRAQVAAILDVAVPQVVREVLSRIDVAGLVSDFVDLDRVAEGLDVDAVAARVDLDRILDRVDLDELASRIDIDRILDRVDLDELAARIDVDRVADRVDLDRAVARVDLDRAVARVDLDPILDRADIVGLARYVIDAIDLPELIRSSTGSVTTDVVRGVRAQGADADEAVQRVVDRLLHRRGPRKDQAPGGER